MADNFDVFVDLSMDSEGQKEILDGTKTVEQHLKEMEIAAKNAGKTVNQVLEEGKQQFGSYSTTATQATDKVAKGFEKETKAAAQAANAQAKIWQTQAAQLQQRGRMLQLQSREMVKIADAVGIVSRTALIGGTAVVGGIFKAANDFIKQAPEATQLTIQWKKAQDSLNESYTKVGRTAAEVALPLLEDAARLAAKAAGFVETHPDLVRAALNVGVFTAAIGTIGILVSKGIKLQADLLFVQSVPIMQSAAELQMAAADQHLVAAQLEAEARGIEVTTAAPEALSKRAGGAAGVLGAVGSAIGTLAVLTGAFAAGAIVTDRIFDSIQGHDQKFGDYVTTLKQSLAIDAGKFGNFLAGIGINTGGGTSRMLFQPDTGQQMFQKIAESLGLLKDAADDTANSLDKVSLDVRDSANFDKILAAYDKYKDADLKLVQDHYRDRQKIIDNALADELEADAKYAADVTKANATTSSQLSKLQTSYDTQALKDETEHAKRRSDILQTAGDDVKKIEQDLQESLRKNFLDHQNRTEDIIAKNDALGLVKENRRFEQQQAEERRAANIDIRRQRADLSKRLQELDQEYAAERAQRLVDFQARAIEIRQEGADRLKELAAQHTAEIKKIHEQEAAKLKELDVQFNAERKRRYDYLVAEIKDLDAGLVAQRKMKQANYQADINDLNAFLAQVRAGYSSLPKVGNPPGHATGGYTAGMVRTGEQGYEWIATHSSVKVAENIIGGKLTQDMFLRAMQALQVGNQATYIDQRKLEVPMSRENKDAYVRGAKEALMQIIGAI